MKLYNTLLSVLSRNDNISDYINTETIELICRPIDRALETNMSDVEIITELAKKTNTSLSDYYADCTKGIDYRINAFCRSDLPYCKVTESNGIITSVGVTFKPFNVLSVESAKDFFADNVKKVLTGNMSKGLFYKLLHNQFFVADGIGVDSIRYHFKQLWIDDSIKSNFKTKKVNKAQSTSIYYSRDISHTIKLISNAYIALLRDYRITGRENTETEPTETTTEPTETTTEPTETTTEPTETTTEPKALTKKC